MIFTEKGQSYLFFDNSDEVPTLFVSNDHIQQVQGDIAATRRKYPSLILQRVPLDKLRQLQNNSSHHVYDAADNSAEQKRIMEFFLLAKKMGASDIHMQIGLDGLTHIEFRVHGELIKTGSLEKEEGLRLASTIVLSMCDQAEPTFKPMRQQDARVRKEFLRQVGLFGARYAHIPTEYGLYDVMRILPDDSKDPPTLDELGFLPEQIALCRQMLTTPEGMILLSGPTGSGKSTTLRTFSSLYMAMTYYARRLLTIEDPPEGNIKGAVQTAIVADKNDPEAVSQAWVKAISASLRLDPDALLIGELRDADSAKASLVATLTGHLVMGTVHTPDAIRILDRLIETFGASASLVADPQMLIGLISQRLVQRLCPHCKQGFNDVSSRIMDHERELLAHHTDIEKMAFRNKSGCEYCQGGVTGRVAIAEVIRPDAAFMDCFLREGKIRTRSYWVNHMSGITRRQHLQHYLNAGEVDPLSAHLVCPLDEDERTLLPERYNA